MDEIKNISEAQIKKARTSLVLTRIARIVSYALAALLSFAFFVFELLVMKNDSDIYFLYARLAGVDEREAFGRFYREGFDFPDPSVIAWIYAGIMLMLASLCIFMYLRGLRARQTIADAER